MYDLHQYQYQYFFVHSAKKCDQPKRSTMKVMRILQAILHESLVGK